MKDVNSYKVVPADQRCERGRPSGAGKDADQPASHHKSSRCHSDADDQQKMGNNIDFRTWKCKEQDEILFRTQ